MSYSAHITAYVTNPIVQVFSPFNVIIGLYGTDASLTDITSSGNLTYQVIYNSANLNTNGYTFLPQIIGSFIIRFFYNTGSSILTYDLAVYAAPQPFFLNYQQIYNVIKQEEPPNFYSQSTDPDDLLWLDNYATSTILADFYQQIKQFFYDLYPESSTNPNWEIMLNNSINVLPTAAAPQICKFLRNRRTNTSLNPFDLAFSISEFIYLLTGYQILVYVQESIINPSQYWILGVSTIGNNTFLGLSNFNSHLLAIHIFDLMDHLTDQNKFLIQLFIQRIIRASSYWTVDYNLAPEDFNLILDLGMSYKGDPRLANTYCLQYSPTAVRNCYALTNPYNPYFLTGITLAPNSGNVDLEIPFSVTVTANYDYESDHFTQDVTHESNIVSTTPSTIAVSANIVTPIGLGAGSINASFGGFTVPGNYNVITEYWVLNFSTLGSDTVLGP